MQITLRFFASLREALGCSQELIAVPTQVQTVGQLRILLAQRGGIWREALAEGKAVRMALNQEMCDTTTTLVDAAEVAFFPPVTGG